MIAARAPSSVGHSRSLDGALIMKKHFVASGILAIGLLFSAVPSLESAPAKEAKETAEAADGGPFFSGTIRSKYPGGNIAMKGVVVTLGPDKDAFVCYDTDLLRVSVGWTGASLKLGNYMKEIVHPQPPEVAGTPAFGSSPGPGWASQGNFADPRVNGQGPLPATWAKYRGLYLHNRDVILTYTVGTARVLERPGVVKAAGQTVFIRTLQIDKPAGQTLLVCDGVTGAQTGDGSVLAFANAGVPSGKSVLSVAVVGNADAVLAANDGRVTLKFADKAKGPGRVTVAIWNGAAEDAGKFVGVVKDLKADEDLAALTRGGPARWTTSVTSQGALNTSGGDGAYVVDTVAETDVVRATTQGETALAPGQAGNPWKTGMFFGGFDFFPDGRAALGVFHGDVWIVSGIDAKMERLTWKRFATGLFQPLGLKVVDGKVYVLGRDQITRLHDLNGDGEADFYENFNNDTVVTANYHEFCLDLHTDRAGNFYFFKGSPWTPDVQSPHQGTLLKVSKDGSKMEIYASGFRAPNGSAIGPHGEITVSDNQGHWMPASKLNLIKPGGFYGMMPAAQHPLEFERDGTNVTFNPSDPRVRASLKVPPFDRNAPIPKGYDQPIAWLPMNMDNSSGGQVWATSEKWGPLKDHLLFMSYGRGTLFVVMPEEIEGVTQAAMVRFPLKFQTGLMRGRVNPKDGQVYVCGVRGWQTDGAREGGFYRVRYTNRPLTLPTAFNVLKDGLKITFALALDPASVGDTAGYAIEQWNYLYTGNYGSPDFSVTDATKKGHDKLEVKSARLAKDGRSVILEIPGLRPADQTRVKMNLKAADGSAVTPEIYNTIHTLGKTTAMAAK
jgi:hypothetical protein